MEKLRDYNTEFNYCFIVSDYDDELAHIGGLIAGKDIAHFTNRGISARLSKDNYNKYKIINNYYKIIILIINYYNKSPQTLIPVVFS